MTQLIVSLEDSSIIEDIKKAIKMLRGVSSVRETNSSNGYNLDTEQAFHELETGDTIVCDSFEDYKKLINEAIQD